MLKLISFIHLILAKRLESDGLIYKELFKNHKHRRVEVSSSKILHYAQEKF